MFVCLGCFAYHRYAYIFDHIYNMSTSCTCGILHCKGLRVRPVPSVPSATDLPSPPKSPIHHGPEGHVRHHASNHSHHSGILTRWCYMVLRSLLLDRLEEIW